MKRENKHVQQPQESIQHRFWSKAISLLLRLQVRWAAFMRRRADRLSNKGKWIWLMLFIAFSTAASTWSIVSSFHSSSGIPGSNPANVRRLPLQTGESESPTLVDTMQANQ